MNDDELDAMLRELPRPKAPAILPLPGAKARLPIVELVLFLAVSSGLMAWAFGVLRQVFGA